MKILIVINDYMNKSNGMGISTQRFVEEFRKAGHEVRIATNNRYGETDYPMDVLTLPVFAGLIEKEGFTFAKTDRDLLQQAVEWADLVHVEDPFLLCVHGAEMAKSLGKPLTGTFHLYPENMTYAVHFGHVKGINYGFMKAFLNGVYDKCDCIQCPTKAVKERLKSYKEKQELWVISNGITEEFLGQTRPKRDDENTLRILSVGRFAVEKNQSLLIKAVALSKHKKNIKLTFAGKGPLEEKLKKISKRLGIQADFKFFPQDELKEQMLSSDLYVHCADIEVEGMSCMEAFACGCVPIISDAELSSTKDYAITSENLFEAGNARQLARQIDFFYEHPERTEELSRQYMDYAKDLSIKKSAEKVLEMMDAAKRMKEEK